MLGKGLNEAQRDQGGYPSEDTKHRFKTSLGNVEGIKIGVTSSGIPEIVVDTDNDDAYRKVKHLHNTRFEGFHVRVGMPTDGGEE